MNADERRAMLGIAFEMQAMAASCAANDGEQYVPLYAEAPPAPQREGDGNG